MKGNCEKNAEKYRLNFRKLYKKKKKSRQNDRKCRNYPILDPKYYEIVHFCKNVNRKVRRVNILIHSKIVFMSKLSFDQTFFYAYSYIYIYIYIYIGIQYSIFLSQPLFFIHEILIDFAHCKFWFYVLHFCVIVLNS